MNRTKKASFDDFKISLIYGHFSVCDHTFFQKRENISENYLQDRTSKTRNLNKKVDLRIDHFCFYMDFLVSKIIKGPIKSDQIFERFFIALNKNDPKSVQ